MENPIPRSRVPMSLTKARQIEDAKNMYKTILERTRRKGIDAPDYEFHELIGKGTYGRVYKCKNRKTQELCAVKIIEVDATDYMADNSSRDDTIKEFVRETSILQSLKDNKVKNVNVIYDAFSVDSWLWIVTEYCPGGSLATLMKANNRPQFPGLEEQFIIPIAREVAVALKYIHEAGVIHRDIKCANILVTEDGRLQLCDFGISNVLENEVSKRSTIIGTPHWMPPELVSHLGSNFQNVRYGTEIDCWAFGCAVYEMATGTPPNARVRPGDLGRTLHREQPRLEGDQYSQELKEFIVFLLEVRPEKRPSTAQINDNQYIKDTERQFPTNEVCRLLEYYALWENSGGERNSLFNPFGAQAPDMEPETPSDVDSNDWNFSTTMEFDKRLSMGLNPFQKSKGSRDLSPFEKVFEEARIKRGGAAMQAIFNIHDQPYDSDGGKRTSDLPLRNLENSPATSRDRTTLIDLDAVIPSFDDGPNLDLDSVPTIRRRRFLQQLDDDEVETPSSDRYPKRATKDWKFPYSDDNSNRRTQDWKFPTMTVTDSEGADVPPVANRQTSRRIGRESDIRNRHTQDWKFPTAEEFEALAPVPRSNRLAAHSLASSPDRSSMINLDDALPLHVDIPEMPRPPTADSAGDSAATDATSGDPFDLEPQMELAQPNNRGSLHMKSQSEPTAGFQTSKQLEDDGDYGSDAGSAHNRSSSMNRSEIDRSGGVNRGSAHPRYRNVDGRYAVRSGYDGYDGSPGPWDPFSDNEEEMMMQEQRRDGAGAGMDQRAPGRHHHKVNPSTGMARPARGSDEGANAGTLRPPRSMLPLSTSSVSFGGGSGSSGGPRMMRELRPPRPPNTAVLMPNVEPEIRARELALMWDELAFQAEWLHEMISNYMIDDDELEGNGHDGSAN